ncbi:MAG: metallophosphoesterase [Vicingaceae bacterium]|nr:metallophosphoesterase [Vicingaceae bacterium]
MYLRFILIATFLILSIDLYYYRALKSFVKNYNSILKNTLKISYWIFTLSTIAFMFFAASYFLEQTPPPKFARTYVMGTIMIIGVSKLIGTLFILIYDLIKFIIWIINKTPSKNNNSENKISISRIDFIKKTALIASIIPFSTLMFGVLKSAFDYTIHNQKLKIPNLPNAFKGLKIVQVSDIHSGSFISTEPLEKAIKMITDEKPDIVFFTGDLVNEITEEVLPFMDTLSKVTAPMGVYSILGNHDYGDYFYPKDDLESKKHNYDLMKAVHKKLGWKLLLNENHIIEKNNERLAILGVENWGSELRFPKLGDIDKAKKGCLDEDVKLLLSHDPTHWDAHVLPNHPDIAATFSGHTHGMQFGVEIPGFKWSPSQYIYKNWAGLYSEKQQQLYVNRGLGFLGYPGRVGILPEITVFELA